MLPASTIPVVTPIVASEPVIDHVPPDGVQLSVVVPDAHTFAAPVMMPGSALIVTIAVLRQPVGSVYVTVAVPLVPPVTTPVDEPIVAVPVPDEIDHVPVAGRQLRVVV